MGGENKTALPTIYMPLVILRAQNKYSLLVNKIKKKTYICKKSGDKIKR